MSTNIVNQSPFLRTSRQFPEESSQLVIEVNKSYIDTANAINARTIGLYPVNSSAITGNTYFITKKSNQTLRQVYSFTSTANIPIGLKISNTSMFVQMFGTYMDASGNVYGLLPASSVTIAGQISFWLQVDTTPLSKSDFIVFQVHAGAPVLVSGLIVLEWATPV